MKKPESIEAAVEIIEALNARTAAYDVQIGELELKILALDHELVSIENLRADIKLLRTELETALNETIDVRLSAEGYRKDNLNLRQTLANYVLSTDEGQAAMREFKMLALQASIVAQQAELSKIVGN